MIFTKAHDIMLEIPRAAVEAIFDECDRYNVDETGGRILGTYGNSGKKLGISVSGVIEPGPNAQRTQTYFKQDGEYQEKIFREIEERVPSIEHLGNWHTHHVNGLRHLSGGDIETYRRTVEHQNHNTDFFYALLVTERGRANRAQRYMFKNYVFRRDDDKVYEIPASAVTSTDSPLHVAIVGISSGLKGYSSGKLLHTRSMTALKPISSRTSDVISQFYPKVKILQVQRVGIYWRGHYPRRWLRGGGSRPSAILESAFRVQRDVPRLPEV